MIARRDHKGRFLPTRRTLNIVPLVGNEASDIDKALRQARQASLDEIVILGVDKDSNLQLLLADKNGTMTERDAVYLIELARANIMGGENELS